MLQTQVQDRELEKYTVDWIQMFLDNYSVLIGDASELAAAWNGMDEREQIDHRSMAMQIWGMRMTLGKLYRTNLLIPDHLARLTELDHTLLEQAADIEIAYGPSIWQVVRNLLEWGTSLSTERGSVQLAVPAESLPALAKHFAR